MGGLRSGRHPWGRTRYEVDECASLDLYKLIRTGVLRPGEHRNALAWACTPVDWTLCVTVRSDLAIGFTVELAFRLPWGGERIRASIACRCVPQPFGGTRWFFVCPKTEALVPKLYLPPGGQCFASRAAHRLAYRSERLPEFQRRLAARDRLARKLGGRSEIDEEFDWIPSRPRGMHHATYRRLERQWDRLTAEIRGEPSWL